MSQNPVGNHIFDVAVIGAGPAGLATACALAHNGLTTALLAAPHRPAGNRPDTRTAALFNGSIQLLKHLGAWEHMHGHCARMEGIRLVDDTDGLLKAPEVLFSASEIGEDTFGYNVPQPVLTDGLRRAADAFGSTLTVIETDGVDEVTPMDSSAELRLRNGDVICADLVAAADGRNSVGREGADISTRSHGYDQTAVTCTFEHSIGHQAVSTEFHRRAGPCTVVPLPGNASSLVWVERPQVAERLFAMGDRAFVDTLQRRLRGLLGTISSLSPRSLFPLKAMTASTMGQNRVALIGEAAHVMPPIGAQGLNLSFRDGATLAELARDAKTRSGGVSGLIGDGTTLEAYNRQRGFDVRTRGLMVDMLNRALTTDLLPVHVARGFGLHAIRALPPLKSLLMREGMQPSLSRPELMRA